MWTGGLIDWVILCSGYVLAAALFYLLGGFERAGEAKIAADARSGEDRRQLTSRPEPQQFGTEVDFLKSLQQDNVRRAIPQLFCRDLVRVAGR